MPVIHNIISIIRDDFKNYASLVGDCTKVLLENFVEMTEALHKDLMGPGPKVLGPNLCTKTPVEYHQGFAHTVTYGSATNRFLKAKTVPQD